MTVRYPTGFEVSKLVAMGDPPYLGDDQAHAHYDGGRALQVISEASGTLAWYMFISAERFEFDVTFYSETGTPVRKVIWRRDDGCLRCVETVDLFYPEGDPGRPMAWVDITNVTREFSSKGAMTVTYAPPGRVSGAGGKRPKKRERPLPSFAGGEPQGRNGRQHTVRDVGVRRILVPEFGRWEHLLAASAPETLTRFGAGADRAAEAYADSVPATKEKDA